MTDVCRNGHPLTDENSYVYPSTGYVSCRTCRKESNLRHQKSGKGKAAKRRRAARSENILKSRAQYQRWYHGGAGHVNHIRKKFGLTGEQYDALLESQRGTCAICGKPPNGQRLAVDHDHRTGLVRGLLHSSCNQTLGFMHEDVSWFRGAIDYLNDPPAFAVIGEHQVPGSPPLARIRPVRQNDSPEMKG